jgi:hypothetical protein
MRLQQQMQAHRSARRHMFKQIGVRHAQCPCRNLGRVGGIQGGAGMRRPRRAGRDGARKIGDRPSARGFRRRIARLDRRAIPAAILGAGHRLVDQHDLAHKGIGGRGTKLGHALQHHQFGGDAFGRRGHGIAQAQDRQLLRKGCKNLGALRIPQPSLLGKRLGMDIGEAQRLHFGQRPIAGAHLGGRTGRTRADFGGQGFQHVIGGGIGERLIAQANCGGRIGESRSCHENDQAQQRSKLDHSFPLQFQRLVLGGIHQFVFRNPRHHGAQLLAHVFNGV